VGMERVTPNGIPDNDRGATCVAPRVMRRRVSARRPEMKGQSATRQGVHSPC
jgi:hypothetical protein